MCTQLLVSGSASRDPDLSQSPSCKFRSEMEWDERKKPRGEVRTKAGLSEQAPEFLPGEMTWGKLLLAIPHLLSFLGTKSQIPFAVLNFYNSIQNCMQERRREWLFHYHSAEKKMAGKCSFLICKAILCPIWNECHKHLLQQRNITAASFIILV